MFSIFTFLGYRWNWIAVIIILFYLLIWASVRAGNGQPDKDKPDE